MKSSIKVSKRKIKRLARKLELSEGRIMRNFREAYPFKCPICELRFRSANALRRHEDLTKHHGSNNLF